MRLPAPPLACRASPPDHCPAPSIPPRARSAGASAMHPDRQPAARRWSFAAPPPVSPAHRAFLTSLRPPFRPSPPPRDSPPASSASPPAFCAHPGPAPAQLRAGFSSTAASPRSTRCALARPHPQWGFPAAGPPASPASAAFPCVCRALHRLPDRRRISPDFRAAFS